MWTAAAGASTGDTASENVSGVTSLQVNIVNLLPDEEERRESRDELGTRDSPVRVSVSISGAAAGATAKCHSPREGGHKHNPDNAYLASAGALLFNG